MAARTSFLVISYSLHISFMFIPPAREPSTTSTGTLVPFMMGFPCLILGSNIILVVGFSIGSYWGSVDKYYFFR